MPHLRAERRLGRARLLRQANDIHRQRFRDAGLLHPGDDGLMDFLIGLHVALKLVIANQFAVQLERFFFLCGQRRAQVLLTLHERLIIVFQRIDGIAVGLGELALQFLFQFQRLLQFRMLLAVALLQRRHHALLLLQFLGNQHQALIVQHGGDFGRLDLFIHLALDRVPLGFRLNAFGLRHGQRAVERLEFFDDNILVVFERDGAGLFAIGLQFEQPLFQPLAVFLGAFAQPFHGFDGGLHPRIQILLDVGFGDGVGEIARDLRHGVLHLDVDQSAALNRRNLHQTAGGIHHGLPRQIGEETGSVEEAALLQRGFQYLAAVQRGDVRVEVFQATGVDGQHVLIVQDARHLRLHHQRRGAAVIRRLAFGLKNKKQQNDRKDQPAQPGTLDEDGDGLTPIREAGSFVRVVRDIGQIRIFLHAAGLSFRTTLPAP
ncbi:MAG: hypothetical protein BWX54_02237 [Verrucomicrobia bacterium ADurb.Bin018]|nr:MAG: hypothetical protein BWX54_02237 [Verrucomicrobia bacterium ADurb.Bin018]